MIRTEASSAFTRAGTATTTPGARAAAADPLLNVYVTNTKAHEGCRLTVYKDPFGRDTIGYGHLMESGDKTRITQTEADALLQKDVQEHLAYLYDKWPGFAGYHPALKQAMLDVMYNVGLEAKTPFTPESWPGLPDALERVQANPRDASAWQMVKLNITRRDTSVPITPEQLGELTRLREPGAGQDITEYLRQRQALGLEGIYKERNTFAVDLVEQAERAAMVAAPAPGLGR